MSKIKKPSMVHVTVQLTDTQLEVVVPATSLEEGITKTRGMRLRDILDIVDGVNDDGTVVPISAWTE